MSEEKSVDFLVVGSGGGGLVAALAAAAAGARVLVVEKLPTLGGTTAYSGGAVWIPNNSLMREAGEEDSFDEAWKYIDGLIGDVGPATSAARKKAYLVEGCKMVDFLRQQKLELMYCKGYSDYYASRPGGRANGRTIESRVFDGMRLGNDLNRLMQRPIMPGVAFQTADLSGLANGIRTWHAVRAALRVVWHTLSMRLTGRKPLTMGMGLVAQLLHALRRHDVELLTEASLRHLLTDDSGNVRGAAIDHCGRQLIVNASKGVLLASGGFAHNAEMRAKYQPLASSKWTSTAPGDEGDGIRAGIAVGAATAQMDEGWWMPTSITPSGERVMSGPDRSKPFSIIVDSSGQRFTKESASYMEVGQDIMRRHAQMGGAIPCWNILDARHRRYYPLGTWRVGHTPQWALDSGYLVRAQTLAELAQRCGIDAVGLERTVARYNRMCVSGIDEDFHRGDDPYDRYHGDVRVKPNPSMGPIEQAPFYAIALYPGDIGTNGGLLTDEHARVLRDDGSPIAGLYATGNCTASVMGRVYPGPGATIGPSVVFGFIGARHALNVSV